MTKSRAECIENKFSSSKTKVQAYILLFLMPSNFPNTLDPPLNKTNTKSLTITIDITQDTETVTQKKNLGCRIMHALD